MVAHLPVDQAHIHITVAFYLFFFVRSVDSVCVCVCVCVFKSVLTGYIVCGDMENALHYEDTPYYAHRLTPGPPLSPPLLRLSAMCVCVCVCSNQ